MSSDPLEWLGDELSALDRAHLRRRLAVRLGRQSPAEIVLDGNTYVNFSSNDYLGLSADSRLAAAARDAIEHGGWGSGASPLITGREDLHAKLEEELAKFEGVEAALLFTSGFAANVGAITSMVGRGDVIFSDAKNHASIIDGCRLSGAAVQIYPHLDVSALRELLQNSGSFRRKLIVTDSLFSMDGDLAPLADLALLAADHGAMLMADEAHATGVFGKNGRGVAEHLGIEDGVHIRVGTLSKALGCAGGFVAGSQPLIDWLCNRARSYVFSTAAPAATCAPALEALKIVSEEPQRRQRLLAAAADLRSMLTADGWNVGSSESQIVPVFVGEADAAMRLTTALKDAGFLAPGIRPPSVPAGESLLRISLSSEHSDESLQQLVSQLGRSKDSAVPLG